MEGSGPGRKDESVEEVADDHEVSVVEGRARLTELMNRAAFGGERIVLTVHGRRVAGLIGMKDFERLPPREAA